ncbi:glycosyltransferase family 4 protein [Halanaerobium hydrogeniformans]|nr:glycosyltransferase family 4 protein [Halanaerobium hydrogeniformans]
MKNNKKRILILANSGRDIYIFRGELVSRLIKEGFEVYFSVPQKNSNKKVEVLENMGAKHIKTYINRRGINPLEDLKLIIDYKNIVKKIYPDLILTYTVKPNIYGNWVASYYNISSIMNITGIGTSLNSKLKYFVKHLYSSACKRTDIVFFQNKSNLTLFLEKNMVSKNKSVLIPGSGVNIDKFKPLEKESNDNKIKFLYIGRVMKEKGIEEYIEASKLLKEKYSNLEFQILGSFEEDEYEEIIEKTSSVKFLGYSHDVRQEIKEADCIVNPSYHEGMSNILLEGAAMAKPLIASNIPGCKEIIENNINGFLFKAKSSLQLQKRIIQFISLSPAERTKMGEESRKKIEKEFDRKIVTNEYLKKINKLI